MKLKENLSVEKYNEIVDNALICEVGFYIGTKQDIDEYIKKRIVYDIEGVDGFIIFYMFCKYVVSVFNDSEVSDIYDLIDENYMRLVGMFIKEFLVGG